MELTSLLLLAVATSMDGFWAGFAVGLRRQRFGPAGLAGILLFTLVCATTAMLAGRTLLVLIDEFAARMIGAAIMVGVGGWVLREGLGQQGVLGYQQSSCRRAPPAGEPQRRVVDRLLDPFSAGNGDREIGSKEAAALGLAVAADNTVLAMAAGIAGFSPVLTPGLFALVQLIMITVGNSLARRQTTLRAAGPLSVAPGLILITIGLVRLVS